MLPALVVSSVRSFKKPLGNPSDAALAEAIMVVCFHGTQPRQQAVLA